MAGTENINNICKLSLYKLKITAKQNLFRAITLIIKCIIYKWVLCFAKLNYKIQRNKRISRGNLRERIAKCDEYKTKKRAIILKAKQNNAIFSCEHAFITNMSFNLYLRYKDARKKRNACSNNILVNGNENAFTETITFLRDNETC